MKIIEYCKKNNITQQNFAFKMGITPAYLSQIIAGIRRPSPELAMRIENLTNYRITRDELVFPHLYNREIDEIV